MNRNDGVEMVVRAGEECGGFELLDVAAQLFELGSKLGLD